VPDLIAWLDGSGRPRGYRRDHRSDPRRHPMPLMILGHLQNAGGRW